MYRMIIIDDEPIAIKSIQFIVNNNFNNVKVVGTARSGKEAVEKAFDLHPDFMIFDINMPGINGFVAMTQIKKNLPDIQFIVASGYDYFDYTSQAINIGVSEYLLKPFKTPKLIEAINKVIVVIEKSRNKMKNELEQQERFEKLIPIVEASFINTLCFIKDNQIDLENCCELLDYKETGGYVVAIEFGQRKSIGVKNKIEESIELEKKYNDFRNIFKLNCKCFVGNLMLNQIIIYVFEDDYNNSFDQKKSALRLANLFYERGKKLHPNISIGIGRYYGSVSEARKSYSEALQALYKLTKIEGEYPIFHIDDFIEENIGLISDYEEDFSEKIISIALRGDSNYTKMAFDNIFSTIAADNLVSIETIKNNCIIMIINFGKIYPNITVNYFEFLRKIIKCEDVDKLRVTCRGYIDIIVECINSTKQTKINEIIEKADNFIIKHFNENITLEDVSREVNLSQYYFSRFYKEETGINFIDKLTATRVEKSKKLLNSSDLSIKEIAFTVGYTDANYFSKIFKKAVGVTASEYKGGM